MCLGVSYRRVWKVSAPFPGHHANPPFFVSALKVASPFEAFLAPFYSSDRSPTDRKPLLSSWFYSENVVCHLPAAVSLQMSQNADFTPEVFVCNGLAEITATARERILSIIAESQPKKQVSLALSGGSTPRKLYESLHENNLELLRNDKRVLFFVGDDRLYPLDNELSNFHMATAALLHDLPSDCVLPVDVTAAVPTSTDPENGEAGARAVAQKFQEVLLNRLDTTTVGSTRVPVIDIVLLGFGSDGHTASVFPASIAASDDANSVSVSFPSPSMNPKVWRVTLTPVTICNARHVIILASGKDKKWVVDGILSKNPPAEGLSPVSRFLRQCKGQVVFVVDQECAGTAAA